MDDRLARRREADRRRAATRRRRLLGAIAACAAIAGAAVGAGTSDGDGSSLPQLTNLHWIGPTPAQTTHRDGKRDLDRRTIRLIST